MIKELKNYILAVKEERLWLKEKPCAACKHFCHYMGSAGVCEAKKGCPTTRMVDYCSYCDCGEFKRKRRIL